MSGSAKRVQSMIRYAEDAGATVSGVDGRGHFVASHPNGETVRIPSTPGDFRGDLNLMAEIRRRFNYEPNRPNSGRHKKGMRTEAFAPAEERVDSVSARYSALLKEHSDLCARVVYLLSENDDGDDLHTSLARLGELEQWCVANGRRPPLRSFRLL